MADNKVHQKSKMVTSSSVAVPANRIGRLEQPLHLQKPNTPHDQMGLQRYMRSRY